MSFLGKFKNKKIKVVVVITVVSSLLIGGYYLYNKESNAVQSEENYVETYTIADNEKIFINGVILPTKSKEFSMPTEGEISKLNVTNGKIVKEGDVLFTIKNESIISEVETLKIQINELKKSNVDNDPIINAEINKLEAQVSALNKKAYIDTTAPFAGKVYLNDQNGNSESASMMTLQSNTFYMKGQTSEQDLSKLKIDDPVTVTILSTNKKVTGRVSAISDRPTSTQVDNTANSYLSYYDIDISFEDQENLVNGFHVQACIEITDSLCKIPSSSILKDENDKPYVFKSYDGILKKQKVEIQSQNDEFTVVKGGLDKQDVIIRYPSDEMNEGDAIPVDTLSVDTEGMQNE
nr:efflux RND transporter periplasmic adaptor subunit [uncultured Romboutsia sp.]